MCFKTIAKKNCFLYFSTTKRRGKEEEGEMRVSSPSLLTHTTMMFLPTNYSLRHPHYLNTCKKIFPRRGSQLRNGVTDWWREQILIQNSSCIRKPPGNLRGEGAHRVTSKCRFPSRHFPNPAEHLSQILDPKIPFQTLFNYQIVRWACGWLLRLGTWCKHHLLVPR